MVLSRYTRLIVLTGSLILVIFFFTSTQSNVHVSAPRVKPAAPVPPIPDNLRNQIPDADDATKAVDAAKALDEPFEGTEGKNDAAAQSNFGDDSLQDLAGATPGEDVKNPVGATKNKEPNNKKPLKKPSAPKDCSKLEFVVMIDAGSTGSRVHVYEFDTCQSPPHLIKEEFKMLKPGLSSFDTDTEGAAKSLDPLLELAIKTVPEAKRGCTPIALKATAGLRMLGAEKSDAILLRVKKYLQESPFAVVEKDGVVIMDGRDEGVYAWITTNYLLGNIGSAEETPTAAVFDLGGGSTQIVFQPSQDEAGKLPEGDHKYALKFAGREFILYQHSHLGYGLMEGRNKVNKLVVESALKKKTDLTKYANMADAKAAKASGPIVNPCISPGVVAEDVIVKISDTEIYKVSFKGPPGEALAQCRFLAELVLNMNAECKLHSCSFNGVFQPSLLRAFDKNSDMFIFSYFYDRTNPLGFPLSFTVGELSGLAKVVCNGETLWRDVLLEDHVKELMKEPQWCLDLLFITALLHTGYNIPLHRELRTANTIADNELGWCLGALLPLLDKVASGWSCKKLV